jgi:hypothetical protein
MNIIKILPTIFIAATLIACGKSNDSAKTSEQETETSQEVKAPTLTREALLPIEKYIPVTMGRVNEGEQLNTQNANMRALFWNGAPLDYEALANDFIPEYKDEVDSFKRSDIAKANKAQLDAAYLNARKSHYFSVTLGSKLGHIQKYDPVTKGFHAYALDISDDMVYQWPRPEGKGKSYNGFWGVRFLGADPVDYMPGDEQEARKIEAALSQRRGGADEYNSAVVVYGRVVGYNKKEFEGDKVRLVALLRVDGISYVDPKTNEVLLTVDKKTLPKEVKFDRKITPDYFTSASN